METITVQIVTYQSEKHIEDCLNALKAQSYPIDNLIIVDNNSSDQTLNIVSSFQDVFDLYIIKNKINVGFAKAHNQALQASNSSFHLILNPDVILHPDYLRSAVNAMERNTNIGSATGKLLYYNDPTVIDTTGLKIKKSRRAFDRGSNEKDLKQWDTETDIFGVSGAAALFRREMIEDISINEQFFDEHFFAYKEDVDVAWRAQLFGWKAVYVPDAIGYHHRGWGRNKSRNEIPPVIRGHSYINRYYLLLKNDSMLFFSIHLPYILAFEILSLGYSLLKERKLLVMWKDFISLLPQTFSKRKHIKKNRKVSYSSIYKYFK